MDDTAELRDAPLQPPPYGCVGRLMQVGAALGLVVCFGGLGLIVLAVATDPNSASDRIPVVAKIGFTLTIFGFTAFVDLMLASATWRMPGLVGKVLAALLLWLPLGIPVTIGALVGTFALWVWVP